MLKYRADIDGLRAIAVLLVLLLHLEVALFSGGFIGVDVFFTISGFLISGIVLKEKSAGNFSFIRFYSRRALRIIPAYLVVLLMTLLIGAIFLAPLAYKGLLESALASSLFVSNMYFLLTQGGYFSAASHELPLLHTWSLSVEEQFYVLMPIAIVLWFKIKNQTLQLWTFAIVFILSLLVSIFLTDYHQKAAYFVVFSRAHEFLIGAALAVFISRKPKKLIPKLFLANALFIISLLTLIFTSILFDASTLFPSAFALIPCLATVMIIYSGLNEQCLSYKVLGNKIMVFIGLISYSLYLYHWPIISISKYIGIEFTFMVQFIIGAISILLAFLSWKYVENKVRYSNLQKKRYAAFSFYVVPSLFLVLFYMQAKNDEFFPSRFKSEVVAAESTLKSAPEKGRKSCHTSSLNIDGSDNCKVGETNKYEEKVVLWGDSHANHFVGFMDQFGKENKYEVQDISMGNCPPLMGLYINAQGAKERCKEKNQKVFSYIIEQKPKKVYLAGSWGGYLRGNLILADTPKQKANILIESLSQSVTALLENNIEVVLFKMVPKMPEDNSSCYLKYLMFPNFNSLESCQFNEKGLYEVELNNIYLTLNNRFKDKLSFISVSEYFCQNGFCDSYMEKFPLYRDTNHLNLKGSELLGLQYAASVQSKSIQ